MNTTSNTAFTRAYVGMMKRKLRQQNRRNQHRIVYLAGVLYRQFETLATVAPSYALTVASDVQTRLQAADTVYQYLLKQAERIEALGVEGVQHG